MKVNEMLSILFKVEVPFKIKNGCIIFKYKNRDILVDKEELVIIEDDGMGVEKFIRLCEIKDIKILRNSIVFFLQDGGYTYQDGEKIELDILV